MQPTDPCQRKITVHSNVENGTKLVPWLNEPTDRLGPHAVRRASCFVKKLLHNLAVNDIKQPETEKKAEHENRSPYREIGKKVLAFPEVWRKLFLYVS
jgi:hypothetical protein